MAEFTRLVITKRGQELLSKIISGIGGIRFTKVCTSSRQYGIEELENLVELSDVKQLAFVSNITKTSSSAIKVDVLFTNTELKEGYNMCTIGLYAVDPDLGEILYAVTIENSGYCYMPSYNGITVSGIQVGLVTVVGNTENISLEVNPAGVVSVSILKEKIQYHNTDETAHAGLLSNVARYRPLATRIRNPDKPDYGLGGGGEWLGTLEAAAYSGTSEVTVVVNGVDYDGKNISKNRENAPNGTIIIVEE